MRLITTPQGEQFWGYDKDRILHELETTGLWEPQVVAEFGTGRVAIEIGANIGAHTRLLAAAYSSVFAVEPLTSFALLKNTEGLHNVTVWKFAGYSWVTPMALAPQAMQLTERASDQEECPSVGSVALLPDPAGTVSGVVLDDLVMPVWKVDLIKVDAQGCDLPALIGLENTILRCHPKLIVEFEPELAKLHGHGEKDYRDWFESHDYETRDIDGVNAVAVWRGWK